MDKKTTLTHLIQKAGYYGPLTQNLLDSIQLTRYQSIKMKMAYEEYIQLSKI